jgi:ubiquinone/menaquinone biosynthesis C-methylase UbiE
MEKNTVSEAENRGPKAEITELKADDAGLKAINTGLKAENEGLKTDKTVLQVNKTYWNKNADSWFGVTALPVYGVQFVTENELHLFGDVTGKTMLEIGCGSGHSLKYHADRHAGELWGLDMSQKQLDNAKEFLAGNQYYPKLICSPMEEECGIPDNYFDIVYSIYAIGWATDLDQVFRRIASYLKQGGTFIFSWKHPLHGCVSVDNGQLILDKSYFDEEWHTQIVDEMEIMLSNRKISTYINALTEAGFIIEKMVEQTDDETLQMEGDIDDRSKKAQKLPLSFIFKTRKA